MGSAQVDPGDLIDPADIDWEQMDDADVWHAMRAGVPQAIAEAERRDRGERSTKVREEVAAYRASRRARQTS